MEWFEKEIEQARAATRARLHKIQFSFPAFFMEGLSQAFFPVSLLWIAPIYGPSLMTYIRNSQLVPLPSHPPGLQTYSVRSLMQMIMLWCAHILLLTSSRYRMQHLWPVVMVADVFHLMRFIVIGIKYGFLTASQRRTIHMADFATSFKMNNAVQLMSNFVAANPPMMFAEVEHTAVKKQYALTASLNDTFGYDIMRQTVALDSTSRSRLSARIAYDIKRIGLDDKYARPIIKKLSEPGDGRSPLSALVVAARLASQPKKYQDANGTNRYHVLLATMFVLIPFAAPAHTEVPGGTRLIWLLPPGLCSCELDCSSTPCFCTSMAWSDILLLLCTWIPLIMNLTFLYNFQKLSVIESFRRGRSLYLWGRILHQNGFPKVRWVDRAKSAPTLVHVGSSNDVLCEIVDGDDDGHGEESENHASPWGRSWGGAKIARLYSNIAGNFRTARMDHRTALRTVDEDSSPSPDLGTSADPSHRPQHHDSPDSVPDQPLLQIEDPESWQAWHVGRLLLQHFGGLFHTRMDAYVSAFTCVFILLLSSVVTKLVLAKPGEVNVQFIYTTLFVMVLIGSPIVCVLILLMNANWQFTTDKHMVSHACTGLRYHIAGMARTVEASPDDSHARQRLSKLESSSSMLAMLIEQLGADEKANPLRFMFVIPVTYEFVGAWFAAVGAVATYSATLIVQALYDQYSSFHSADRGSTDGDGNQSSTDGSGASPPSSCVVPDEFLYDAGILHRVLVGVASVALVVYAYGQYRAHPPSCSSFSFSLPKRGQQQVPTGIGLERPQSPTASTTSGANRATSGHV